MIAAEVKYKKTGIDWMPEVPEHWGIVRLKNVTKIVSGATPKSSVSANWDGNINWVTPAEFGDEMYIGESVRKITKTGLESCAATLVPVGSVIISNRAPIGSLGISKVELCTNQGCKSIIPTNINNYFLYFVMSLQKEILNVLGNGTTFRELATPSLRNYKIPLPPKEEQDQIADYLYTESAEITRFIQTKQRFIELLKEQRQSIIIHAVTKGIDEGVKMKETVLGEIPEHWEVRRLKNIGNVVLGKMLCNEDKGGYSYKPYLKSKNIGWEKVIIQDVEEMWFSPGELITFRVKENDLLVSEGGEVGKTCIWKNEIEECYIQNSVHKITCFEDCFPEFYLYYLGALGSMGYFKAMVNQVSIAHLTREKLVTVKCVHPNLREQKQIVKHIKSETRTLDIAISKADREIELIKEYREAMIAEAVTGKMKMQ